MSKAKELSITIDANTSKLQLKLKAIAKHAEALAQELDEIDNACECGSNEFIEMYSEDTPSGKKVCAGCGAGYFVDKSEVDDKS